MNLIENLLNMFYNNAKSHFPIVFYQAEILKSVDNIK